jgi:hypothetical protein
MSFPFRRAILSTGLVASVGVNDLAESSNSINVLVVEDRHRFLEGHQMLAQVRRPLARVSHERHAASADRTQGDVAHGWLSLRPIDRAFWVVVSRL